MNNKDLIRIVAIRAGIEEERAAAIIADIFSEITLAVERGDSCTITHFGSFSAWAKPSRREGHDAHVGLQLRPCVELKATLRRSLHEGRGIAIRNPRTTLIMQQAPRTAQTYTCSVCNKTYRGKYAYKKHECKPAKPDAQDQAR